MCWFDLSGKLIRFTDRSRYSSGKRVMLLKKRKEKNRKEKNRKEKPRDLTWSKQAAVLLGAANYFHHVKGVHFLAQ